MLLASQNRRCKRLLTKLLDVAGVSAQKPDGGRGARKQDAAGRLAGGLASSKHIQ